MSRLLTKNEKKYYENLPKIIFSRSNKFFRRNVHLNHKDTYIKIVRITNNQMFHDEVQGYKELPRNVCFYLNHVAKTKNNKMYFKVTNIDYVITDSRTNKVIAINQQINDLPDFFNIWILRKNVTHFLKLKIGDIFFTR